MITETKSSSSLKESLERQLRFKPYSFWAKKFDRYVHVPEPDGPGTVCGSAAALLGNNYAADIVVNGICPNCIKALEERGINELQIA